MYFWIHGYILLVLLLRRTLVHQSLPTLSPMVHGCGADRVLCYSHPQPIKTHFFFWAGKMTNHRTLYMTFQLNFLAIFLTGYTSLFLSLLW